MVHEGLARLDGVVSVSERADDRTATCEIQTIDGRLLEPHRLAAQLSGLRVGARLRGVEVAMDGRLERTKKGTVLRVPRYSSPILLVAARRQIALDPKRRQPARLSREQRRAYRDLRASWDGKPQVIRVIGRLDDGGSKPHSIKLEVQGFKLNPTILANP